MFLPLIGLIPLLPLAGFVVCGLLGKRLPKAAVTAIACGSVLLAFVISVAAVLELRSIPPSGEGGIGGPSFETTYWTWIPPVPFEAASDDQGSDTTGAAPIARATRAVLKP